MSTQIKQGRKPIASRPEQAVLTADDVFGNKLAVDPELMKAIDEAGYVARFVDAPTLYKMNGYHERGWVPLNVKELPTYKGIAINKTGFKFGNDPDGIVRRGSLILAVKTKDQVSKHKTYLKQRAERYSSASKFNAEKAQELRKFAQENQVGDKAVVHEGFEENED